jgi:ATP-binding cassette subfamily B protein
MISKYYGKKYSLSTIRELCYVSRNGVSLSGLNEAAKSLGYAAQPAQLNFEYLSQHVKLPCIVHWNENHFIIVYKITPKYVYVVDPGCGKIRLLHKDFLQSWASVNEKGFALLLEPTAQFYQKQDDRTDKFNIKLILNYIFPHKKAIFYLFILMLIGSGIQLILPFLTQALVDKGISKKDIGILQLILFGQLILIFSQSIVGFIRNWIIIRVGTRINISMIHDFLKKLIKLSICFFDSRMSGDILQRIGDQQRIEEFITRSFLNILLTFINLIVFSFVLIKYNTNIFFIFIIGSILYLGWVNLFLRKRREIDYELFNYQSKNQDSIIQIVRGMQEIKLNNCGQKKIDTWVNIREKTFNINLKSLKLNQYQQSGSVLINEVKNIIITFITAQAVINDEITFGMMLAIQYILGQLNGPIEQMVGFVHSLQDAKIGFERIDEIHKRPDEQSDDKNYKPLQSSHHTIKIKNVSFQYDGPLSETVLSDISLAIPPQQTTAIVGMSGCGKTTLLKLLLGFYKPTHGKIHINDTDISDIDINLWREKCGIVMQDSYIFFDSIEENIALKDNEIDYERLKNACHMANIERFINSLPLKYKTKVGSEGIGLSQGQKQRLLIARAVYKNPEIIIFDEATNSLDSNNENEILKHLELFFKGKTVIIAAHRLSTVKNADQIVVMNHGKIIECGAHEELISKSGEYFRLIKNQLSNE